MEGLKIKEKKIKIIDDNTIQLELLDYHEILLQSLDLRILLLCIAT